MMTDYDLGKPLCLQYLADIYRNSLKECFDMDLAVQLNALELMIMCYRGGVDGEEDRFGRVQG